MNLKLTPPDRISISIFMQETLAPQIKRRLLHRFLARDVLKKVEFQTKEVKLYGIETKPAADGKGTSFTWDKKKGHLTKEISFSRDELKMIRSEFDLREETGGVTAIGFHVYEVFFGQESRVPDTRRKRR